MVCLYACIETSWPLLDQGRGPRATYSEPFMREMMWQQLPARRKLERTGASRRPFPFPFDVTSITVVDVNVGILSSAHPRAAVPPTVQRACVGN